MKKIPGTRPSTRPGSDHGPADLRSSEEPSDIRITGVGSDWDPMALFDEWGTPEDQRAYADLSTPTPQTRP